MPHPNLFLRSLGSKRTPRLSARQRRGFTLVELMVVVVIMGVLAAVGLRMVSRHAAYTKAFETVSMIQSIRAAQERYRAENLKYLDVSRTGLWYPRDPSGAQGRTRTSFFIPAASHIDGPRWFQLNPTETGPVYAGYQTTAGMSGEAMTAPDEAVPGLVWPTPTDVWYVIQATADIDGDGTTSYYLVSSINSEVYSTREAE